MEERRRLLNRTPTRQTSANNSPNVVSWSTRFGQGAVLITVALERLAFYGMTGNLVLFFNEKPYAWESYNALLASLFFVGISYLTSFFGGIVADSFLGRFKTLILSLIIYSTGYAFLPVLSYYIPTNHNDTQRLPVICRIINSDLIYNSTEDTSQTTDAQEDDNGPFQENCPVTVFVVLFVIAVGAGTYRANIAPFGGDQSRGEGQHTSFFNWYYWSVNLGTLVALSVVTYLQQQVSFFSGFLTAAVCLGVSFLVFLMGSCTYVYRPRTGSVVKNIVRILCEACSARKSRTSLTHRKASTDESSSSAHDASDPTDRPQGCLDYAKFRYGGNFNDSQVEDVKKLGKIVFVFLTLIPYWMVYFQMQTTFLIQGLHMKLNVSGVVSTTDQKCSQHYHMYEKQQPNKKHTDTQIVAAWFSLFDVIFVIILIPIVDRILYPRLARSGHAVSAITRIAIGMIFAMMAMVVAGVVENFRLQSVYPFHNDPCHKCIINQTIGVTTYYAANMSVFWQIPQYALIGVSEVFTCVAGIDFAYQMAPRSMKGIIMGVFYLFTGIGSFLGIATMFFFQNVWFFKDDYGNINLRRCDNKTQKIVLEQGHLDFYFFFLGGIALFGFIVFIIVAKCLRLEQDLHNIQQQGTNQKSIPGVVDNPPSYSSVPISERSSYGRRSRVEASIQGEVSP